MVINLKIEIISANSPAKAKLLKIIGHTVYYNCTKCNVKGDRTDYCPYFSNSVKD